MSRLINCNLPYVKLIVSKQHFSPRWPKDIKWKSPRKDEFINQYNTTTTRLLDSVVQ